MIAFNSTTQVCRLKLGIGSGKNGLTRIGGEEQANIREPLE